MLLRKKSKAAAHAGAIHLSFRQQAAFLRVSDRNLYQRPICYVHGCTRLLWRYSTNNRWMLGLHSILGLFFTFKACFSSSSLLFMMAWPVFTIPSTASLCLMMSMEKPWSIRGGCLNGNLHTVNTQLQHTSLFPGLVCLHGGGGG